MNGYKFVTSDMRSKNGDSGEWVVGKWKKWKGGLEICKIGFHDCESPLSSLEFVYGDRWFETETRGKHITEGNKSCHSEMRLVREIDVKKVCLRFAIACARRSLSDFEKEYPKDDRPRKAIEAAEAYAKDPSEKNESAAWSAARSAELAAWSAARSAESAARSAESAALSAVRSAESAARSAESAAWSAARSAAWSAARSAESAAWSAARSAESKWQTETLLSIIKEAR